MLAAVAAEAQRRGFSNIETVEARAENLPFPDTYFDFLATRFSAHHWRDARAGLREARRVLRAGAPAVFIDVVSPEAPALDTFFQAIELLRDISHVRDYSRAEWRDMFSRAGFAVKAERSWRLRMDFADWTARIGTPAVLAQAIRALQQQADEETRGFISRLKTTDLSCSTPPCSRRSPFDPRGRRARPDWSKLRIVMHDLRHVSVLME